MEYKTRHGISLITLIITIVVIIVLLSVIILNLTSNNSINQAKITKLLTKRDNIESNVKLYVSNIESETKGYFKPKEIIAGNVARHTYTVNELLNKGTIDYRIVACDEISVEKNQKTLILYKIDEEKYKEKTGKKLEETPNKDSAWYVSGEGNIYLAFNAKENIPKYLVGNPSEQEYSEDALLNSYIVITDIGNPSFVLVKAKNHHLSQCFQGFLMIFILYNHMCRLFIIFLSSLISFKV